MEYQHEQYRDRSFPRCLEWFGFMTNCVVRSGVLCLGRKLQSSLAVFLAFPARQVSLTSRPENLTMDKSCLWAREHKINLVRVGQIRWVGCIDVLLSSVTDSSRGKFGECTTSSLSFAHDGAIWSWWLNWLEWISSMRIIIYSRISENLVPLWSIAPRKPILTPLFVGYCMSHTSPMIFQGWISNVWGAT